MWCCSGIERQFRIVDTAGMRRPGRVASGGTVEAVSVVLAKRAMARADVVVLVVDATEGAGDREGAIAGEAEEAGCGIVIAVNKWDLVKGQGQDFVKKFDDQAALSAEVPGVRADRPPVGADGGADAEAARGRRSRRRGSDASASRPPSSTGFSRRSPRPTRPPARPGARCGSSTPRRRARRRPASSCSRTSPRSFTFRTSGTSSTSCATTFGFEGTPIRLSVRRRERKGRK